MTTRNHGLLCKLRNGHTLGIYSVQFSPDDSLLYTCSHDGSAAVWELATQAVKRRYVGHPGPVYSVHVCPAADVPWVLTAGEDGTARVWQPKSGRQLFAFTDQRRPLRTAVWSSDGGRLATAGDDGRIIVYDGVKLAAAINAESNPASDAFIQFDIDKSPARSDGHRDAVRRLAWARNSRYVLSASEDGTVKYWDLANGARLARTLEGHASGVNDVRLDETHARVITASSDGSARIWGFGDGAVLRSLRGHRGAVYAATFTAEGGGRRAITGGHDRVICVWQADNGALLQRMEGVHASWVLGLAVKSDGCAFASASGDRTVGVWYAQPADESAVTKFKRAWLSFWDSVAARGAGFWDGLTRSADADLVLAAMSPTRGRASATVVPA
jgi:WD40 repeat protein